MFLPCDRPPVSTAGLVRAMADVLGVKPRGIPAPGFLLRLLLGRRLGASLEIDCDALDTALAWSPPHTLAEELAEVARWWRAREEDAA